MTDIRISRLTLRCHTGSEAEARQLARLVSEAISRWSLPSDVALRADALQVKVTAHPDDSVNQIAASVAAAVESAVRQAGGS